jgi:hypothetical protein
VSCYLHRLDHATVRAPRIMARCLIKRQVENWNITERDSGVWFSCPGDGSGNVGFKFNQPKISLCKNKLKFSWNNIRKDSKIFVFRLQTAPLSENATNRTDYSFKTEEPKLLRTNLFGTHILNFLAMNSSENFY